MQQAATKQGSNVTSQLREVDKLLGSWKQRKQQRLDQHKALKVHWLAKDLQHSPHNVAAEITFLQCPGALNSCSWQP